MLHFYGFMVLLRVLVNTPGSHTAHFYGALPVAGNVSVDQLRSNFLLKGLSTSALVKALHACLIHPVSLPLVPIQVRGSRVPACIGQKAGKHPGQVASLFAGLDTLPG